MTNLKPNIFHSKKLRFALMVLVLFSGSVLGGAMLAYITKPKEACAQCVAVPTFPSSGRVVAGGADSSNCSRSCAYMWGGASCGSVSGSWACSGRALICPSGSTRHESSSPLSSGGFDAPYAFYICVSN